MQAAVVDTSVLYAAGNRNSDRHERALDIVRAADRGRLPRLRVPDVVLVETMNGLNRDVGHEKAVDMLERLEASNGYRLDRVTDGVWNAGLEQFRTVERLSLADGVIAAYLRDRGLETLYSFDGGFDGLESITRLDSATDPFDPE